MNDKGTDADTLRVKVGEEEGDLSDEAGALASGEAKPFLLHSEVTEAARRRREDDEDWFFWTTMAAEYAVARFRTYVDELDRVTLQVLRVAHARVVSSQNDLDELRRRAVRDDLGRLVYRTADGRTGYFEGETALTDEQFKAVKWQDGGTTWEQFQAAEARLHAASDDLDSVRAYRERLAVAKERIDGSASLTEEELKRLEIDLHNMPASVRRQVEQDRAEKERGRDPPGPGAVALSEAFKRVAERTEVSEPPATATLRPPAPRLP